MYCHPVTKTFIDIEILSSIHVIARVVHVHSAHTIIIKLGVQILNLNCYIFYRYTLLNITYIRLVIFPSKYRTSEVKATPHAPQSHTPTSLQVVRDHTSSDYVILSWTSALSCWSVAKIKSIVQSLRHSHSG
jgi:hypothetical protein